MVGTAAEGTLRRSWRAHTSVHRICRHRSPQWVDGSVCRVNPESFLLAGFVRVVVAELGPARKYNPAFRPDWAQVQTHAVFW